MVIKISFPWILYFKQLFAVNTYVRFINPFNFWHRHKIKHLEKCSELDLIEHLERCYQKKCPQAKTRNCKVETKQKIYLAKLNSPEPIPCRQLFVVWSRENLKYRGIEYSKPKIIGIYFDRIALDSHSSQIDYPLTPDF